MKTIELKDLIGEFWLDAVDYSSRDTVNSYGHEYQDCSLIRFRLNDISYTIFEDPDDGYRSSMGQFFVSDEPMINTFTPQWVVGTWQEQSARADAAPDVIDFIDVWTGKVVLSVGTDHGDAYYPSFVANFNPENMAINQGKS